MTKVVVANRLEYGGKTFKGGDIIDVKPSEARELIGLGKVRAHVETPVVADKKVGK